MLECSQEANLNTIGFLSRGSGLAVIVRDRLGGGAVVGSHYPGLLLMQVADLKERRLVISSDLFRLYNTVEKKNIRI